MITNLIIALLYGVVYLITAPLRLLSDVVLSGNISAAIDSASKYLGGLNAVIPVTTLLAVFAIFLVVEIGIMTWRGINWVIRKIPSIN
jgi:hypothetical protein